MKRLAAFLIALGLVYSFTAPARAVTLAEAVAFSKRSGFPMLVVGTGEGCAPCQALKQRIATDEGLQPLLGQYVTLVLDVGSEDFRTFAQQYPPSGNGIPMVFIVSAQGEQIHNASGAPQGDGLNQLLAMGIERTGGLKQLFKPAEDRVFLAALERSRKSWDAGKRAEAVTAMVPYFEKVVVDEQSNEVELKYGALVEEFSTAGKADAQSAADRLAESTGDFDAQVLVVATDQVYGKLPAVAETLAPLLEQINALSSGARDQLQMFAKAQALEAANAQNAARLYRQLISKHANTEAAQRAQNRLDTLVAATAANRPAQASRPAQGASNAASIEEMTYVERTKRAGSLLKNAQQFVESRPERALHYAKQALEFAPAGSAEHAEAESIISALR